MAEETKKEKPRRLISPAFDALFAWIAKPNTKHDKNGKYQVSGLFDPKKPDHRAFLAELKKEHTAAVEKARAKFKPTKKQGGKKGEMTELEVTPFCYEDDNKPGMYRVNFSEKAFIVVPDKVTKEDVRIDLKPLIVDAKGAAMDPTTEVWSGSTIKVAIDVAHFFNGNKSAGVSLRLKGVQVLTLRTRGSRDGASLGFGVEEGFGNAGGNAFSEASSETDTNAGDDFLDDSTDEPTTDEAPSSEPAKATDNYDF